MKLKKHTWNAVCASEGISATYYNIRAVAEPEAATIAAEKFARLFGQKPKEVRVLQKLDAFGRRI